MAELEPRFPGFVPMPPPFMREGHNADEPIMIGSSDDEGEGDGRPVGPGRATIAEQRARLHHNRTGTPIPRILEHGLRIMSPPPPLPVHHPPWIRRPDWPHPGQHPQSIHERLANLGVVRSPEAWRRLLGHEHVGRILGFIFPGLADQPQRQQEQPQQVEYDVRMTHSRAKPRLGFTFDFAPDEEEEGGGAAESTTKAGPVRTRTTIVIPDSPPVEPVDRKGKGRARTPPEVAEVLDLESGEWAESVSGPSTSASASTSSPTPRKRRAVETIEILSDDDEGSGDELVPVQGSILVCASCRRPLRMGGGRLWALRCGHMIDSRCYRRLGERPIVQEEAPIPAVVAPVAEPAALRATKRRRVSGGGGRKGKGKPKARPEPVAAPTVVEPYQAETLEWTCPVHRCGRAHWSERMVTAGKSAWQPMKETGAIGVFV